MKFEKATLDIINFSVEDVCTISGDICSPVTICDDEF